MITYKNRPIPNGECIRKNKKNKDRCKVAPIFSLLQSS